MDLNSLRPGDTIIVGRLSELASTYDGLRKVIAVIHERRAVISETETGWRSDDAAQYAMMLLDAAQDMRKGPPRKTSHANGALGGRPRKVPEMPPSEAELIWRDVVTYRTDGDAAAAMTGWTRTLAYRRFGRSGRPRSKQQ